MRYSKLLLASLTLLLLTQTVLSLKVPTFVSFQGKLSNSTSGEAYNPASLMINITNQSQLEQVEWGSFFFNDTTDEQGVFDIILGKRDQLNLTPGWQYQLVVAVDLASTSYEGADLYFGDLDPAGDSILITGGGPATAAELIMTDNLTTVQDHDHSGGGKGVTILGPAAEWLNVSNNLYVTTGIKLGDDIYRTTWPEGTAYTAAAGGGLELTGTAFHLMTGCDDGQLLKNQSGGWECDNDDGGTAYAAGMGLVLASTTFSINASIVMNKSGTLTGGGWCMYDDVNEVINCDSAPIPYTAQVEGGLALDDLAFRVRTCSVGQVVKNQTGGWVCAADETGGGENSTLWQKYAGLAITSNQSVEGGNVNVTGNMTVGGYLRCETCTANSSD
ncbi:MAG: hypothetical protein V1744_07595, partial [Candidatus Altiarchaeota archaeon]